MKLCFVRVRFFIVFFYTQSWDVRARIPLSLSLKELFMSLYMISFCFQIAKGATYDLLCPCRATNTCPVSNHSVIWFLCILVCWLCPQLKCCCSCLHGCRSKSFFLVVFVRKKKWKRKKKRAIHLPYTYFVNNYFFFSHKIFVQKTLYSTHTRQFG